MHDMPTAITWPGSARAQKPSCISHRSVGGRDETGARCRAPSFSLPQKGFISAPGHLLGQGFISAPGHLLGLPNFPSMNYVEQKMLKWEQIPFSQIPSFHKSIAEGRIAQEYTCGQNSILPQGPHEQAC